MTIGDCDCQGYICEMVERPLAPLGLAVEKSQEPVELLFFDFGVFLLSWPVVLVVAAISGRFETIAIVVVAIVSIVRLHSQQALPFERKLVLPRSRYLVAWKPPFLGDQLCRVFPFLLALGLRRQFDLCDTFSLFEWSVSKELESLLARLQRRSSRRLALSATPGPTLTL